MTAIDLILQGFEASILPNFGAITFGTLLSSMAGFCLGLGVATLYWWLISSKNNDDKAVTCRKVLQESIVDNAPFPIWGMDDNDSVTYKNASYFEGLSDLSDSSPMPFETPEGTKWFTASTFKVAENTITFALPVDTLVETEQSLKRFMETLSTTFAHLPIGIAIFDCDKSLALFNPSLCDLLKVDPAWLARRPTLSTFLEKLRDNKNLPEHKNFLEWRRLLISMERVSREKHYNDQWHLPSGQILNVSGQAHEKGAITFLFHDITPQIDAERNFNSSIALNQAILDNINDTIFVLDSAGKIVFANAAFDKMFCICSTETLENNTISKISKSAPKGVFTDGFWDRLRGFISQNHSRLPWQWPISGKTISVFPMPDGSTLIHVSNSKTTTGEHNVISFFEFADASYINQDKSIKMQDPFNLHGLTSFLKQREISFDTKSFSFPSQGEKPDNKTRRILWYLTLVTENACRNGGQITLHSEMDSKNAQITCTIDENDILVGQENKVSLSLVRQLIEHADGGSDWSFNESNHPFSVSCKLPLAEAKYIENNNVKRA